MHEFAINPNLFGSWGRHLDGLVFGVDVVEEVEDAAGIVGDAVVGPRLEVEVEDPPLVILQGETDKW